MKNLKFVIFFFLINSCVFNQVNKEKVIFNIRFDSCFDNDTVSLYLDNNELFNNYILKTNDIVSLTPIYVSYLNNGIIEVYNGEELLLKKKIELNKSIKVTVFLNDNETSKSIEISNGKNITIDGCAPDSKVNIHQYKKKVIYD